MSLNANLKLCTWNVTGIMSSASYLCDLLTDGEIDICGISEHWLPLDNLFFIDTIISDYDYFAVCDESVNLYGSQKMNKGGVAFLWRDTLANCIVPLELNDDWIIGIKLQISPSDYIFIFQVYLPCVNYSNDVYSEFISKLYDLYCIYSERGIPVGPYLVQKRIWYKFVPYSAEYGTTV